MTGAAAVPRSSRIPWVLGGLFVAVVVLGVVLWSRFGSDPNLVSSPLIGAPVPAVTLPYLEEPGELALADLDGEIVVVNFWASWCVPCRAEHAQLVAAAEAYRDAGVRFVGVSYQDSRSNATGFLDELGRGYDYVIDERARAAIEFGVFGVPETFFVDRTGTVVGNVRGPVEAGLLFRALDTILAGGEVGSIDGGGPVQGTPDQ